MSPKNESDFNVLHFRKSFIKRYTLALFLIALLSTLAFAGLMSALKQTDNTAHLVNLSGKQRMLSQAIALEAYRLHQLRLEFEIDAKQSVFREDVKVVKRINALVDEMALANRQLSQGQLIDQKPVALSETLSNLYFGPPKLASEVESYLALAKDMVAAQQIGASEDVMNALRALSRPLLVDLDRAVKIYQDEGEEKLLFVKLAEVFVWVFTLIVLLLEVIFIFQPLVRRVVTLTHESADHSKELQYLVELRTLKLEKANEKLANLAYHDPLTGLYNRLNLERDVEMIIEQYRKHHSPFAVFMLDIDWFKQVNDQHGHEVGDFVLKEFASLLVSFVRQNDSVYRAGGEEFVIIFDRISLEEAQKIAEHIRLKVEAHHFIYHEIKLKKTISIGVYHSELMPPQGVKAVLKQVDEALYHAKAIGRNRVSLAKRDQHMARHKDIVKTSICFNQDSFNQFYNPDPTAVANCLVPTQVSPSIHPLLEVMPEIFMSGVVCLRAFMHADDLDVFKRVLSMGKELPKWQEVYRDKQFLWSSTLRVVSASQKVKIIYLEAFFIPGTPNASAKIELVLCESQQLHNEVGDALMVYNFHAMLENTNDFIYFKDQYHVFTAASKTLVAITNVNERSELVGKTDYEVFPKAYADTYFKLEKQVFSGEVNVAREVQLILDKNGDKGWVDNRKYPIKDQDGKIIGLFGIARIISASEYESLQNHLSAD